MANLRSDIQTRFIVFCDYALISSDGKLSIIGEFDHYFSTLERPILNKAFLVARLQAEAKKEFNLTLQLTDEKGKGEYFKSPVNAVSGEDGKLNIILNIENLSLGGYGLYKAVILDGKQRVAECNLHVVKFKNPQPAQS